MRRYILTLLCAVVALASLVASVQAATGNLAASGPALRQELDSDDRSDQDFDEGPDRDSDNRYTLAVVGDMPYGDAKIAAFPGFIDFVNQDRSVELVAHLGDIKSGSTLCTNEYFASIRQQFDRLNDPVVYTPGDNEWTDCHRANNGNYKPTERLARLRSQFFPEAGKTIGGRPRHVLTQARERAFSTYVENVMWMQSRVIFVTLNVPGSNDDSPLTNPWTGAWVGNPEQGAEQVARDLANLVWLNQAFALAEKHHAAGVVLMLQADMWDNSAGNSHATLSAFDSLVEAIGDATRAFGKPVLMLVGDSHVYTEDHPYDGSPRFTDLHPGYTPIAPNLTRIIVEGSTTVANRFEYVRLKVDPKAAQLFSWDRVDHTFAP
jgi:hypothetical protein